MKSYTFKTLSFLTYRYILVSCLCVLVLPVIGQKSSNMLKESELHDNINEFSLIFYREISREKNNVIISPLSIHSTLAMVYGGAIGTTAHRMAQVLKFPPNSLHFHNDYKELFTSLNNLGDSSVFLANSVWIQDDFGIRREYLSILNTFYNSAGFIVDFTRPSRRAAIIDSVNNWVSRKTDNEIDKILNSGDIDGYTRLLLVNAIMYRGEWKYKFNPKLTREDTFHVSNNKKVRTPFMNSNINIGYHETELFQSVRLPYSENQASMFIILPRDTERFEEIAQTVVLNMPEEENYSSEQIRISIPSFSFSYKIKAREELSDMGMEIAFTDKADFSGISGSKNLKISDIIHKGFIQVTEEGTKASAATVVPMMLKSANIGKTIQFRANRPFIFIIQDDKNEVILFIGHVFNPSISSD